MASTRKKAAAPALDEAQVEAELAALRRRLLVEGGVKLSTLKPQALAERLVPALVAEGFEVNATWIRRPLRAQLEQALAHGAAVARKSLGAQLRGASTAELQQVLDDAEGAGRLKRVLRGKAEVLVGSAAPVLSAAELLRLRATVSALDVLLSQALRRKGLTLLASDVQQALEEALQLVPQLVPRAEQANGQQGVRAAGGPAPQQESAPPSSERGLESVVAAVDATRDDNTGLSFVPDVVRRLLPAMPAAVARSMLLLAANRELVELRPEGGLGRLTAEDLELCPPGPAQTRLSWARLLEGGQA
ncbi:MAG: hypothetical protein RL685_2031 [Pseudomonadota bacterium]|jgi:hypothetical protein